MKVSIIVLTYNSEKNIKTCIDSIKNQTYKNIENIIIDGKSKDNTIKIIEENKIENTIIISEKDKGIYDAWNKGFKYASGDIIGTVMSDDYLNNKKTIENIVNAFKHKNCDILYGNMQFELDNEIIRKWKAGDLKKTNFYFGWMPPPPTVYVDKKIKEENEMFNEKYKIAADYDWLLRILFLKDYKVHYLDDYFYTIRMGGVSNNSIMNIFKSNKECYQSWIDNGISKFPFWIFFKPLLKITQVNNLKRFISFYRKS